MLGLIKELNKLGTTGMSNIYLSSCQSNCFFLLKKSDVIKILSAVKILGSSSSRRSISFYFKTSCNLKTRGLRVTMFSELYSVKLVSQAVSSDLDITV